MYHRLASIAPIGELTLEATFVDGTVKRYDVAPLISRWPAFAALRDVPGLFRSVHIDAGGYGIVWNDELDLECEELWTNGITMPASTVRYPDIEVSPLSVAEAAPPPHRNP